MLAASYWSLLDPAVEIAEDSKYYGAYSFLPVAFGFLLGALFVFGTDIVISSMGVHSECISLAVTNDGHKTKIVDHCDASSNGGTSSNGWMNETTIEGFNDGILQSNALSRRKNPTNPSLYEHQNSWTLKEEFVGKNDATFIKNKKWKRILLLIVAVTIHNIPEGLAVGVAFGAIGNSASATFESARNLAIGIGIQNFPEGLAVSLPLKAAGFSTWRSFWYGQMSGMVEPVAGILGAVAVGVAQPLLPYALAFAAGAMIYVVINDIIPEANTSGNNRLSTWGAMTGFVVMMMLDVGLN